MYSTAMVKIDAQQQTGIDMSHARARTSIDVTHLRDFLHRELPLAILPLIGFELKTGYFRRQRRVEATTIHRQYPEE
jgi:hypothetical protein